MADNEIKKFRMPDADGNPVEYEIIAAFENTDTNRQYIVFTDNTKNDNGAIRVSAVAFTGDLDGQIDIEQITTQEEWDMVNGFIADMNKEIEG